MRPFATVCASIRRYLLFGGLGVALLAGCTSYPVVTHDLIELPSCVDNARAVRFLLSYSSPLVSSLDWEGGSPNVLGTPSIIDLGGEYEVTAELDNVDNGDLVTLGFSAHALSPGWAEVADIQFFTVPPDQIVDPGCIPGNMPEFTLDNSGPDGLDLEVSDPSSQPLMLMSLELAESPDVLPASMLDWSGPEFNALPWHPAIGGATPLDPAAPPLVIDLPEATTPGTEAVLCRFVSLDHGVQFRGITEVDFVSGPLRTQPTTWGAVKALYRN